MKSKTENKKCLHPKLRFKEFLDGGDWEEKKLGDICEILNNQRQPISSNNREKGQYPYYGASGIVDYVKDYIFDERLVLVGEDGAKWGSNEKTAFIAEGKYWVNNHAHVLKPIQINDVLLTNFLVMTDLKPFITGAAPPKLTLGKLKSISIPLPRNSQEYEEKSKLEQQKIADCLSSLDELIDAEDKKLEALQRHKKGLMQELFPSEGQTLPKRRFPEFKNSPEWEEKPLGKIANILQGYGFPEKYQGTTNGLYPFYKVSDISNSILKGEKFIKQSANYIDETTLEILKAKLIPIGTTIFAKIGEAIRLNRRVITTAPCLIDNNVAGAKKIDGEATDLFLYYTILGINFADHCGGAVPSINKSTIESVVVICPKPKEQKKIADCLSSLDEFIEAQAKKLDSLLLHKKGLMQQLFPTLSNEKNNEV